MNGTPTMASVRMTSKTPPPLALSEEIRDVLARTLGDPSLELRFWLPTPDRYIDRTADLGPEPGSGAHLRDRARWPTLRRATYDPSLLEDSALIESVSAAARLAMENSRLQAELRAQLLIVRDSRARIVSAADAERRRIERNLHDGAQQRLLALRLALRFAGQSEQREELEQQLAAIDVELADTLDELRALARGLHPPILTAQGLSAAVESLARRAALPVRVTAMPEGRLPGAGVGGVLRRSGCRPRSPTTGLRAAQEIRAEQPDVPVLLLSQYVDVVYALKLVREGQGGIGYLLKDRIVDPPR